MDSEAIIEKFNLQKKSQTNSPLKDVNYRIRLLRKLYKNIKLLQKEIFEALKMDLNKSEVESYMCEVGLVLNEISFMLKHIRKFILSQKSGNSALLSLGRKAINLLALMEPC